MSILCIRLPSRSVADIIPNWVSLPCPYAQIAQSGAIEADGVSPLSALGEKIAKAQRIVLLLSASDVTILQVAAPPLSASRLKAALPNLVEEHLLSDPADSVIVAGEEVDGLRTIAVVRRAWLAQLANTLITYGARQVSALPSQLCLALNSDESVSAAAFAWDNSIDLTVRKSEHQSFGVTVPADEKSGESEALSAIQSLAALVPLTPATLYVPHDRVSDFQDAVSASPKLAQHLMLATDNWSRWIGGALNVSINLMSGLGRATAPRTDWRPWRWALVISGALLLVNIGALNFDWWRMKSEASALRIAMVDIYRSAYPKETVIIDPMAQLKQKINLEQSRTGVAGSDPFTAVFANFGEAWARVAPSTRSQYAIASLDFHDRSLLVRLKPNKDNISNDESDSIRQQLMSALAKHDMSLEVTTGDAGQLAWKIRSAK